MKSCKKISRRAFLDRWVAAGGAAALAGTGILPSLRGGPAVLSHGCKNHRNVLLLISDDHGLSQLGCYGNPKAPTRNLDALAAEGVRFTNTFTVAASCSASRGTLLSGLYPHHNGQYGHQHSFHHFSYLPWVKSLPALLKSAGYRTGVIGKLHVAPPELLPFDLVVPGKKIMGNRDVKTMARYAGRFFRQEKERPFFLLMGYSDPHRHAAGMSKMRGVENFSGFGNDLNYPGVARVRFRPEDVVVPPFLPDIPEVRDELADQYGAIARLDAGIGMVLDELRKSGRYEDTLIIYLSDNGIPFPNAKTTVYDAGVHVPMIVRAPGGGRPGITNDAMVSFVDLLPTVLDWTGAPGPNYELPGRSFLPILFEEHPRGWNEVYLSHTFHEITMYYPMRGIRTRRFKYIHNLFPELEFPFATDLFISKTWQAILKKRLQKIGKRPTHRYLFRPAEELYDLQKDPDEVHNVAGDPAYAKILQELRAKLHRMRERTDDHWLVNENYRINRRVFG